MELPGACATVKKPQVPMLGLLPVTLTVEASSSSVASSAATDESGGAAAAHRRVTPRRLTWGRQGPQDEEEQEVGVQAVGGRGGQGSGETGRPCLLVACARPDSRPARVPTGHVHVQVEHPSMPCPSSPQLEYCRKALGLSPRSPPARKKLLGWLKNKSVSAR